jgi:hypothetical protein
MKPAIIAALLALTADLETGEEITARCESR